jgi:hypothetical protein
MQSNTALYRLTSTLSRRETKIFLQPSISILSFQEARFLSIDDVAII